MLSVVERAFFTRFPLFFILLTAFFLGLHNYIFRIDVETSRCENVSIKHI